MRRELEKKLKFVINQELQCESEPYAIETTITIALLCSIEGGTKLPCTQISN